MLRREAFHRQRDRWHFPVVGDQPKSHARRHKLRRHKRNNEMPSTSCVRGGGEKGMWPAPAIADRSRARQCCFRLAELETKRERQCLALANERSFRIRGQ